MRRDLPWVALTREKTLTGEAKAGLERVGSKVFAWSKGAIVAAGSGGWRKAQLRSIQSIEDWTLSASAHTNALTRTQLAEALFALTLTRDGAVPLDASCPSFSEALLGPRGWALDQRGTVVATDGAVKEDGRMGRHTCPSATSCLPARLSCWARPQQCGRSLVH